MIFNDQPFYNEPGYEYRADEAKSEKYNRKIEHLTINYAMVPWLANALKGPNENSPESPCPKNSDQNAKGKKLTGLQASEAKTKQMLDNTVSQTADIIATQQELLAGKAQAVNELEDFMKFMDPNNANGSVEPPAGPSNSANGATASNWAALSAHPTNAHHGNLPHAPIFPGLPPYSGPVAGLFSHIHHSVKYPLQPVPKTPDPSPADASTSQTPKPHHPSPFSGVINLLNPSLPSSSSPSPSPSPSDAPTVHPAPTHFHAPSFLPAFGAGKRRTRPRHEGDDPVWADVIRTHFSLKADMILATAREWERRLANGNGNGNGKGGGGSPYSSSSGSSAGGASEMAMAAAVNALEYQLKRHGFND